MNSAVVDGMLPLAMPGIASSVRRVCDLTDRTLNKALRHGQLRLHIGPFTVAVCSSLPRVAEGIRGMYHDYRLAAADSFVDFNIKLRSPRSVRRWLAPQVVFALDDQMPFTPLPANQAFALLEWSLNWCVAAHISDYLSIHAAVVARGDRTLILPAPSGSGKSTLCAALVNRGWRLLSDELALVSLDGQSLTPIPRPVSLKNHSIELIGRFAPDAVLGRPARDTAKGTVAHMRAPAVSVQQADRQTRPAWIVFPRYRADSIPRLQPLSRSHTLLRLINNAFNYHLHGEQGFVTASELVDRCRCYQLDYNHLDSAIAALENGLLDLPPRERS